VNGESQAVRVWVVGGGGENSMVRFQLKRGGDRTKRCRKMKYEQRARLGSMGN
jgi:hypothetical protein